jgi:hypothetical protein
VPRSIIIRSNTRDTKAFTDELSFKEMTSNTQKMGQQEKIHKRR